MNVLYNYQNGNTDVKIFSDGTKIRTFIGESISDFPESMDVKITNYCDPTSDSPICAYCHEKSNLQGKHGDLNILWNKIKSLPSGIELALGGGNVLAHPALTPFLVKAKEKGFISNITINQKHILDYNDILSTIVDHKLVYGIGISYQSKEKLNDLVNLTTNHNLVFHMIMGINTLQDVQDCYDFCNANNLPCKILVLGYKNYGWGINYLLKHKSIETNKYQWYIRLAKFFKIPNMILSFDNLAIEQLSLKRYFTDEGWSKFFMGEDGKHTMYVDAVLQEFAKSSTSQNRVSFNDTSLIDFFKNLSR